MILAPVLITEGPDQASRSCSQAPLSTGAKRRPDRSSAMLADGSGHLSFSPEPLFPQLLVGREKHGPSLMDPYFYQSILEKQTNVCLRVGQVVLL